MRVGSLISFLSPTAHLHRRADIPKEKLLAKRRRLVWSDRRDSAVPHPLNGGQGNKSAGAIPRERNCANSETVIEVLDFDISCGGSNPPASARPPTAGF